MRLILRVVLCIIFSFTCYIVLAAWSGPHELAINELRQQVAYPFSAKDELSAANVNKWKHETSIIKRINMVMMYTMLFGNVGIIMLTRKRNGQPLVSAPSSPTESGKKRDKKSTEAVGYCLGIIFCAFWTVPAYGWGKGLLAALFWPAIIFYRIFWE